MQQFDEAIIYNIYAARENLSELLQTYPTPTNQTLSSVDELGAYFAKDCTAIYTKNFDDITARINNAKNDEVICIFTAGNLDFQIRQLYK